MAEIKVMKTREGILLSGAVPPEIASSPSFEIFPLRDGAYVIVPKGMLPQAKAAQQNTEKGKGALTDAEKEVLRKLLAIRFENRIPAFVNKTLAKEEKETLEALMQKKMVQVLHGGKYEKDGVYSVSDFAFASVRDSSLPQNAAQLPISSPEHLERNGWMVLDGENEARAFGNSYPEKVKSGDVLGQRGFDRKYYFVKKGYVEAWEKKIQASLAKSEKTAEELASEIGIAPEGCSAILIHLAENGEVMEKRKGKYARA